MYTKSSLINAKLNVLLQDSGDDALKEKYETCSKTYTVSIHNLMIMIGNLYSGDFQGIPAKVDDIEKELKSCKHEFNEKSDDPAHMNEAFGYYVEIVRAATNRVNWENATNRVNLVGLSFPVFVAIIFPHQTGKQKQDGGSTIYYIKTYKFYKKIKK